MQSDVHWWRGRPRTHPHRNVPNGCTLVADGGCQTQLIPVDKREKIRERAFLLARGVWRVQLCEITSAKRGEIHREPRATPQKENLPGGIFEDVAEIRCGLRRTVHFQRGSVCVIFPLTGKDCAGRGLVTVTDMFPLTGKWMGNYTPNGYRHLSPNGEEVSRVRLTSFPLFLFSSFPLFLFSSFTPLLSYSYSFPPLPKA